MKISKSVPKKFLDRFRSSPNMETRKNQSAISTMFLRHANACHIILQLQLFQMILYFKIECSVLPLMELHIWASVLAQQVLHKIIGLDPLEILESQGYVALVPFSWFGLAIVKLLRIMGL